MHLEQKDTVKNLKIETQLPILSYIKFRSNFYSSFRDLANSTPSSERFYQISVADPHSAKIIASQYDKDGADYLMLKPGMTTIDLISMIKCNTYKPVGVYQVSERINIFKEMCGNPMSLVLVVVTLAQQTDGDSRFWSKA